MPHVPTAGANAEKPPESCGGVASARHATTRVNARAHRHVDRDSRAAHARAQGCARSITAPNHRPRSRTTHIPPSECLPTTRTNCLGRGPVRVEKRWQPILRVRVRACARVAASRSAAGTAPCLESPAPTPAVGILSAQGTTPLITGETRSCKAVQGTPTRRFQRRGATGATTLTTATREA